MKLALFVGLGIVCAVYVGVLVSAVLRARRDGGDTRVAPSLFELALGFWLLFKGLRQPGLADGTEGS